MANRIRRSCLLVMSSIVASGLAFATPADASVDSESAGAETLDLGTPDAEVAMPLEAPTSSSAGRATATATTKPRTTTVSSSASGLFGVVPTRVLDTRTSVMLQRGVAVPVSIAGTSGVPASAVAAAINLTVTNPVEGGFVTASPCGAAFSTSTINFDARQTVANLAVVGLGDGGKLCLTASTDTHAIVDLSGYVAKGGQLYSPVAPSRILDTRGGALIEPMTVVAVQISGVGGVPASGVMGASINLTVTASTADGYALAFPCGTTPPESSNVNFAKGRDAGNGAVVRLDAAGRICLVTSVRSHLLIDLTGWFGATGTEVQAATPERLLDTRKEGTRADGGETVHVFTAPGALGGVINVTVAEPAAAGYVTVWPCDQPKPSTSAVNFAAGRTVANAALAPVSVGGEVCLESTVRAHLIVDRTAVLGLAGTGRLDTTGNAATDWALTQTGAVYAAMNPYRFGDSKYGKAWDCDAGAATCSKVDTQNKTRTTSAGSFVYDCSGLVVAAWLRAGVDLVKQGASWTEPMLAKLPQVTRETAQVGDLIMFDFDPTDADPVDHVGMYLSPTEMVHAGTCPGGTSAVCRTTINWKNAVAVLRPSAG